MQARYETRYHAAERLPILHEGHVLIHISSFNQTNSLALQLAELEHLASQSKDRVIHFGQARFEQFAGGRRRPYALIFFLAAKHLLDKPQLQLGKLRREFGLVSAQVAPCF